MKVVPAIRTMSEIDQIVSGFSGTWVRRKNAEKKLISWSNDLVEKDIELQRVRVRKLKSEGAKEYDLRPHFSKITQLELRIL